MTIPTPKHLYPFTSDTNDTIGTAHLSPRNNPTISHSETEGMTFSADNFNKHLYCTLSDVGLDSGKSWSISFWFKAGSDIRSTFILGSRGSGKQNGGHTSNATLHIEIRNSDIRYGMHGNDAHYTQFYSDPPGLSTNNFLNTSNYHLTDYVHWVFIYDHNNTLGNNAHRKGFYINGVELSSSGSHNQWNGNSNGIFTVGNGAWSSSQNSNALSNQKWLNLAIYDIPLNSSQVQSIYNLGKYQINNTTPNAVYPLDISNGIVSWYSGDSYNVLDNKWIDKTTTFDISSDYIRGNLIKMYDPTKTTLVSNRNNNKYHQKQFNSYLSGNKDSGIVFCNSGTAKFLSDVSYTFFHVARRNPIPNNTFGRIFDGSGVNWYSGFNDASSGVTVHDGSSINIIDKKYGNNWVISVDRPNYYRSVGYSDLSNGYYDTNNGNINSTNVISPHLTIHNGDTTISGQQKSEWNVAELITYNRLLEQTEENNIVDYLIHKYLGTNRTTTDELFQLPDDISNNNMIIGYPPNYLSTQNIIGFYTPRSYNDVSYTWSDISPYKNDLIGCGTPTLILSDKKHKNLSYVKGSKGESYEQASGFIFPNNFFPIDGSYTLIHVSRRAGDSSGRIFDSSSNLNFYSGFADSKSGVALHSVDVSSSL